MKKHHWTRTCTDIIKGHYIYTDDEGNKIAKTHSRNVWTGKEMSEQVYHLFDAQGNKIGWKLTLADAKKAFEEI